MASTYTLNSVLSTLVICKGKPMNFLNYEIGNMVCEIWNIKHIFCGELKTDYLFSFFGPYLMLPLPKKSILFYVLPWKNFRYGFFSTWKWNLILSEIVLVSGWWKKIGSLILFYQILKKSATWYLSSEIDDVTNTLCYYITIDKHS